MTNRTPTPWNVQESEHGIYPIWAKCGPLDVQPAVAHGADDAAFIVKAVNSHDALEDFVRWVDSWVSNPVSSYSVNALDGLFGMTRDKIAALASIKEPA